MSETINLDSIAIIYDGDYVSSVPNTYKAFLELLRDKASLTNEEFKNKTVWRGDFPITCKKDFIKAIRRCKDDGIMQIDIVSNELDLKEGIGEKDYMQFLELKEPEEEIKINIEEEENKEETIYIESNVNEFYAITQVTQYYKNNNNKPVELNIIYPLRKEINFKKFTININGKKACSRIFDKEKAEENYSDTIASGNVGVFSKYTEEDPNSYSITIGNVAPDNMIELTSEFIQFITSDDMSLNYSVMTNYPTFSDGVSKEYLKNVSGKIILKTHSKITRLINRNFTIDKYFQREFNEDNTSCNIEFKILNDSKNYNSTLNLLFRTEKINEPYLLSQYNPEKDETSYIFGMIYDQKPIPVPEKPDTDLNINYYTKYQSNEKTETPSLFIFLIDQSGSMAGSSMRLVSESLLFFLQSLPRDSYFQLIGFGSTFKKINDKPLIYNKENVKNTMDIVKNLKANLGGTDISSPLKDIFNSKDYDDINLGRNLFILTDGEVDNREECLELISTNCEKFKVHAIGIGSSFDKKLIQNAGIQGKGSYHFVNNVSDVNSIIIQSLSKCLREYLLNAKLSLDKIKPEYEFLPKNNFIYPDEILNYYFILKGKYNNENIQINFESSKKNENFIFSNDKIIKENDGEIIGQIIIGNILKNEDKLDENVEIKLSKNYQVLSKKTTLFAVGEGNESNKIAEFKQVKKKEKNKSNYFNNYNNNNNIFYNNFNNFRQMDYDRYDLGRGSNPYNRNNNINYFNISQNLNNYRNYNMGMQPMAMNQMSMNMPYSNNNNYNMFNNYNMNSNNDNFLGGDMFLSANNNNNNYNYNNSYNGMNMMNNLNNMNMNFSLNNNTINTDQFENMSKLNSNKNDFKKNLEDLEDNNIKEKENDIKSKEILEDFKMKLEKDVEKDKVDIMQKEIMKRKECCKKEMKEDNCEKMRLFDLGEEKMLAEEKKLEFKKVEFNPKELILTQDIFDGCWNINPQTSSLIEKEKEEYNKIEKIVKEKNLDKEEIRVTLLVLYYLNTDSSINKIEYSLIIKKGINYLQSNGINFEEILNILKN